MYICGYFVLSNGPNREVLWIIPIFWVIFGQNFDILTPGTAIYRVPSNCYANDIDDIALRFNLNVFLWSICVINGSNWEDFGIISIFGVIFGQNLDICPPRGARI